MIFSNLFSFLWHFSLPNQETVIETAPEAEDGKRICDKLAGNPALTIVEVLIPTLISGAVYGKAKQFSMPFSQPDFRSVPCFDQAGVQQVIKH